MINLLRCRFSTGSSIKSSVKHYFSGRSKYSKVAVNDNNVTELRHTKFYTIHSLEYLLALPTLKFCHLSIYALNSVDTTVGSRKAYSEICSPFVKDIHTQNLRCLEQYAHTHAWLTPVIYLLNESEPQYKKYLQNKYL